MTELTYAYAADIVKSERDEHGDLFVYGKATGPDRDLDGQRCDPTWLKKAMPDWFTWANVREMHQPVAAGIGVELTSDGDDWYVKSKVVDQNTARKIEAGALKGYSIGVKSPHIDKRDGDEWIAGGDICEISYVDRPCLPTAKMMICKVAGADVALVPVEVADAARPSPVPTPKDLAKRLDKAVDNTPDNAPEPPPVRSEPTPPGAPPAPEVTEHKAGPDAAPQATGPDPVEAQPPATEPITVEVKGNAWDPEDLAKRIVAQLGKREFTGAERATAANSGTAMPDGSFPVKNASDLKNAVQAIGRAKDPAAAKKHIKRRAMALKRPDLIPDAWKGADADLTKAEGEQTHDPAELKTILRGLVDCMKVELDEMVDGDNEICDLGELLCTVRMFTDWWSGEAANGETDPPFTDSANSPTYIGMAAEPDLEKTTVTDEKTSGPSGSVDETRLTELVKSALADALAPSEERMKALETDLAKALALPEPGGPVIARTATQAAVARDTDAVLLKTAASALLVKADRATDPYLAKGYRERAALLTAQAVA